MSEEIKPLLVSKEEIEFRKERDKLRKEILRVHFDPKAIIEEEEKK